MLFSKCNNSFTKIVCLHVIDVVCFILYFVYELSDRKL